MDSNPPEVNRFFQDVKVLSVSPLGGNLGISGSLKNFMPEKIEL
jgi:hypothetical protein